jgi:hypothetical protein
MCNHILFLPERIITSWRINLRCSFFSCAIVEQDEHVNISCKSKDERLYVLAIAISNIAA